jgi:hypothetical protein
MSREFNYWEECISEALHDAEISATKDQIEIIASWVEGAHENYGMAHGYDCIPNPTEEENKQLRQELKIEREKIDCDVCNGEGRIITQGPYHSSNSQCWKCNGEGRVTP